MGADHSRTSDVTSPETPARARDGTVACLQAILLFAMVCCVFENEFFKIVTMARRMGDWAHVLALPVLIGLTIYGRRDVLRQELGRGSFWGAVLLGLAIMVYAAATWPFYFGYIRKLQFVTAAAGIILAVGGWSVLKRCVPVLLLMLIAIPLGWNTYATLVIRPESMTLEVVARLLDAMPGIMAELRGPDITAYRGGVAYSIALADPHRGFVMPLAYLSVVVFVTLVRVRPWWQVLLLAGAAPLIVLFCNLVRLFVHGAVTIYSEASPLDGTPRMVAAVTSLILAYAITAVSIAILNALLVEDHEAEDEAENMIDD